MMKVKEFVEMAKKIAKEPTIYYSVAGGDWCKWNGTSWNMDCVCMIKGILWGFNFNKNASHGGAVYGSNGVYDDDADQILNRCTNISRDFSRIEIGELLHMGGHVGVYIGNRQVVESTGAWEGKTVISEIGLDGKRSRNGVTCGYWKEHGKLKYVDYSENKTEITTETKPSQNEPDYTGIITYQAYVKGWLPEVNKCDDSDDGYAGVYGRFITGFRCKPQYGEIIYEAHLWGGKWIGAVNSKDYSTGGDNSYAGIYGKAIDGIRIKSTRGYVDYRVHTMEDGWLPWARGFGDVGDEFAGVYGHVIDGIQMK